MKFFGIGPTPFRLNINPGPTPGPGTNAPVLRDFDVYYTDAPVLGFDFTVSDMDTQCSFIVAPCECQE